MLEVFKIVLLSTIAITLWTAFLLFQDKRGIPILNRWFAVFLIALTTPQMDLYATLVVPNGIFLLSLVSSTFLWLKGPFIWMFLGVLTRGELKTSTCLLHFAPWLAALSTLLLFNHLWVPISLLGSLHMLAYLLVALIWLLKKKHYIASLSKGFKNTGYFWLLYVIGGLMLLVGVDFIVISLVNLGILTTYNLLDFGAFPLFSIYVFSIGILTVYRPRLFFNEAPLMTDDETSKVQTDVSATSNTESKIRYLELDESSAQILEQELTKLMRVKQLFRQNELSLPDLARQLGVSTHQLSELLNVHLATSFYEFLNGYRLDYACSLLKKSDCQLRILDIAFEAGFNNKNSFYKAFKDTLGVTPNQFRAQILSTKLHSNLASVD